MSNKAQGMSLNVVIIAVIALIVLIVLILIFTGKTKIFTSQTTETAGQYTGNKCEVPGTNNKCVYSSADCQGGAFNAGSFDDCSQYGAAGCCQV